MKLRNKRREKEEEEEFATLEELASVASQLLEEGKDPEKIVEFIAYLCQQGKCDPEDAKKVVEALADAVIEADRDRFGPTA